MLLTIMALLAREQELPRERAKFYEKAVEVLCHHWDVNRNLELPDRYLNADDKKDLLRRIAMRMQAGEAGLKGNIIQEADLEDEIQAFLIEEQWQTDAAEARKAVRRIIKQLRERNHILCLRGPHLYGFVHRTFLEYLTAAEYVRRFDKQPQQMTIEKLIEQFDQHCLDDDWREVLRLICGQIDEQFVGRIIVHLAIQAELNMQEDKLIFAMQCLSEARNRVRLCEAEKKVLSIIIRLSSKMRAEPFLQGFCRGYMQRPLFFSGTWFARYFWADVATAMGVSGTDIDVQSIIEFQTFGATISNDALQVIYPKLLDDVVGQGIRDTDRSAALLGLSERWPDEGTRNLLCDRAVHDEHDELRSTALQALAEKWPDENTRKLLCDRAVHDEHDEPRSTALHALAEKWPDENTRKLLCDRAVQDRHGLPRSIALQALAEKWSDERIQQLLCDRAPIDGAAASVFGRQHSEFGGRVFWNNAYDWHQHLDPHEPISQEQIEWSAKAANVSTDKIDEMVRSLSAHLGWDITKGSAG